MHVGQFSVDGNCGSEATAYQCFCSRVCAYRGKHRLEVVLVLVLLLVVVVEEEVAMELDTTSKS